MVHGKVNVSHSHVGFHLSNLFCFDADAFGQRSFFSMEYPFHVEWIFFSEYKHVILCICHFIFFYIYVTLFYYFLLTDM